MAMTRKDYELIAEVIRSLGTNRIPPFGFEVIDVSKLALAETFGSALAEQNPRFDRQKFIDAATRLEKRQLYVGKNGPATQPPAIVEPAPELLACGCPAQIVADEGHQSGCANRVNPTA